MSYFKRGVREWRPKDDDPGPSIWSGNEVRPEGRALLGPKVSPSFTEKLTAAQDKGNLANVTELQTQCTELLTYIQQNADKFSIAENEQWKQELKKAGDALTAAQDKVVRGELSYGGKQKRTKRHQSKRRKTRRHR